MSDKKQARKSTRETEKSSGASKPISFYPLPFEEALDALLATDSKAVKELECKDRLRREKKRAAKKR